MIINQDHPDFKNVKLIDKDGKPVSHVATFDTKTKIATIYLTSTIDGKRQVVVSPEGTATLLTIKLVGVKLIDKRTGKPYRGKNVKKNNKV